MQKYLLALAFGLVGVSGCGASTKQTNTGTGANGSESQPGAESQPGGKPAEVEPAEENNDRPPGR